MKNLDMVQTKEQIRESLMQAIKDNDTEAFSTAMEQMAQSVAEDIRAEYASQAAEQTEAADRTVLAARGVRQLTSEEKKWYQKFAEVCQSRDPKQALSGMSNAFPETVINAVFDDLRSRHPLLSKINFLQTNADIKMFVNTNENDKATWGDLCDEILKEAAGGIKVVETGLFKLSAFLYVCKQLIILGPEWIDRFVRETLYEYFGNGLEYGIVTGTGKSMPIGMDRQVGDDVVVVAGVYPKKELITIENFGIQSIGNLLSQIAVDEKGNPRVPTDLILVVNPADYYGKVAPAVYIMAPDGSWRSTMPFGIEIIQSSAVTMGEAILGMAGKYVAFAGASKDGVIDYSDHYHFVEDERTYIIKGFANGMPKDNKAFVRLDISDVQPPVFKFENVTYTPSDDATLANLKIGSLELDPDFDPDEDEYEAETTNATNIVTATPADAGATVKVMVGSTEIPNGTAATWATGENVVTITVTAEDGTTTEEYTVTVTKS